MTSTERLVEMAEGGEKLSSEDRRRALAYLKVARPELSKVDLAEMFSVSEGQIRKDLRIIVEESTDEMRDQDPATIIAEAVSTLRRQVADIEGAKKSARKGSRDYMQHCVSIADIQFKLLRALQEVGYLPKDASKMAQQLYEYAAVVLKGDNVDTRPIDMFDGETRKTIEARKKRAQQLLAEPVPKILDIDEEPAQREVVFVKPDKQ